MMEGFDDLELEERQKRERIGVMDLNERVDVLNRTREGKTSSSIRVRYTTAI